MEEAFLKEDMHVGPEWHKLPDMDIRQQEARRLIWAFVIVFQPEWIHMSWPTWNCNAWFLNTKKYLKKSKPGG